MIKPIVAAFLILLAAPAFPAGEAVLGGVALAQPPIAAPVGPGAESQSLAAPAGAASSTGAVGDAAGGFNIVSIFLRADIVVQSVMVLLLLASLWSWTIIFNKLLALSGLKRKAKKFEKLFWSGQSLDELYQQFAARNDHPLAAMFIAGLREWRRGFESDGGLRESMIPGVKDRIEKAMSVTILRETDGIEKQLGILATIGSVSPLLGLLGTTVGIINAFTGIATKGSGNLAAVAPGVAEALVATFAGLAAAIPAVIAYNLYVNRVRLFAGELEGFANELIGTMAREGLV